MAAKKNTEEYRVVLVTPEATAADLVVAGAFLAVAGVLTVLGANIDEWSTERTEKRKADKKRDDNIVAGIQAQWQRWAGAKAA